VSNKLGKTSWQAGIMEVEVGDTRIYNKAETPKIQHNDIINIIGTIEQYIQTDQHKLFNNVNYNNFYLPYTFIYPSFN